MLLSKESFVLLDDSDISYVEIPEWQKEGEECPRVRVRSLMSDQRSRVSIKTEQQDKSGVMVPGGVNALICAMAMIDASGALLFADEAAGVSVMARKHPVITARIANKIWDLSNLTRLQREELEKKLLTTSPTDSPSGSAPELTPDTASTLGD